MNQKTSKTTRHDRLKGRMAEKGVSFRIIGELWGVSGVAARKRLLGDTIDRNDHAILLELGLPRCVLPKAKPKA